MSDMERVFQKIYKLVEDIRSKQKLEKVGEETAKMVRNRTRLGYGSDKGKKYKLSKKPLSEAYKKQRKKLKKKGQLSKETSAGKSNLTLTGDMLNDIVSDCKTGEIDLTFDSEFSQKKAGWAEEGSDTREPRPFFDLTKQEVKRVADIIQDLIDELSKKF